MCDDCLLTRREAAQFIKTSREGDHYEAYTHFLENLIWIFDDTDFDETDISDEEVEQIFQEIQVR